MIRQSTKSKPAIDGSVDRKGVTLLASALIVLTVFAAYWPATRGGFIWDDDFYVLNNETLRSFRGLFQIWFKIGATPQYYPLVFSSFWVEYHLWGLSPPGYHIVNILLHSASAILIWRILTRLEIPGALVAALVFAIHPVHVESVAWITERKNVLSGFLYVLSLRAFLGFSPPTLILVPPHWRSYAAAMLFFVAALLSKTVTATLPAALLLIYWFKLGYLRRRELLAVVPMFVIGLIAGSVTALVEKHHVGTKYLVFDLGIADRIVLAGRIVWFYFAKLVWPAPLIFIYPRWTVSAKDISQWLYPTSLIAIIFLLLAFRKKWGRGPLVALLFFAGTLFPALGFVDVYPMRYSYVADHFQYLASLGPIVLVCALATRVVPFRVAIVGFIAMLLILSSLTFKQCLAYRSLETLWRDTLAKDPHSSMALNNLGTALQARGELLQAEQCYHEALAIPDCQDRGRVLFNLATSARQRGDIPQSIEYYRQAIAVQPNYPKALVNLAGILQSQRKLGEAIDCLDRAIMYYPEYVLAHNNLASALLDDNRPQEAIEHLNIAIRLNPEFPIAHFNLGNAYTKTNRPAEAETEYLRTIALNPRYADAHVNLASLLQKAGRFEEAVAHLTSALQIDPNDAVAHFSLGNILARQGRRQEAISHYQSAQRIRPDIHPPKGFETP